MVGQQMLEIFWIGRDQRFRFEPQIGAMGMTVGMNAQLQ